LWQEDVLQEVDLHNSFPASRRTEKGCDRAAGKPSKIEPCQVGSNRPIIFHSLIMAFTGNVTAADVPPIKKLHSFLLSESGTQSRKVKYWGLTKEEAYSRAKKSHPEKNILWLKELI
jgi:hypothetical protein|tara:strand:+ start:403 stop:753 length:351 start_codon:yes stop_codon:yes gene_type:complete